MYDVLPVAAKSAGSGETRSSPDQGGPSIATRTGDDDGSAATASAMRLTSASGDVGTGRAGSGDPPARGGAAQTGRSTTRPPASPARAPCVRATAPPCATARTRRGEPG